MDYIRREPTNPAMHPGLRTALEALCLAFFLTLMTTLAVNWVLSTFGYTSEIAETLMEAQRWFTPMFAYLWGMFWMIESGRP